MTDQTVAKQERDCPFCAESIESNTQICHHCGSRLNSAEHPDQSVTPSAPIMNAGEKFCTNCGGQVDRSAVACIACGASPQSHKKFCRTCGIGVQQEQVVCLNCGSGLPTVAAPAVSPSQSTGPKYCTNCGQQVDPSAVACTSCGAEPRTHKKFCFNCGTGVQLEQVICLKCGVSLAKSFGGKMNLLGGKMNLLAPTSGISISTALGIGAACVAGFGFIEPLFVTWFLTPLALVLALFGLAKGDRLASIVAMVICLLSFIRIVAR